MTEGVSVGPELGSCDEPWLFGDFEDALTFWCQPCEKGYKDQCPEHGIPTPVVDQPMLTLAEGTLPSGLQLVKDAQTGNAVRVCAKKIFAANTIFGPFVAPIKTCEDGIPPAQHHLLINVDSNSCYLDLVDVNKCNWMMFVRRAESYKQQNLVVVQQNNFLFLVSTKVVLSQHELRFGYSSQYAKKYQLNTLCKTQESRIHRCEPCGIDFSSNIARIRHSLSSKCKGKRVVRKVIRRKEPKLKGPLVFDKREDSPKSATIDRLIVKTKRIQCPICSVGFDQPALMELHMKSHQVPAEDIKTEKLMLSDKHEQLLTNGRFDDENKCPSCLSRFPSLELLLKHVIDAHNKRVSKSKQVLSSGDDLADAVVKKPVSQLRKKAHLIGFSLKEEIEPDTEKKSYPCQKCDKNFSTYGAFVIHQRSHKFEHENFFGCFLCDVKFRSSREVNGHVETHAVNGLYYCPHCPQKSFESWLKCRKHVQTLHSGRELHCDHCDKVFSRPDKLRLHLLTHSDIKEHMCETCGKQFSRKDKLLDHIRRLHQTVKSESSSVTATSDSKKFKPRVLPTDYQRFIYKCVDCALGFKRRGMLINHVVRVHPTVPLSSIPELNLPILRTQREFHCNHCNRVYKSSSKRKLHILKSHPGSEIPPSLKSRSYDDPDPAFSNTVGSITFFPYSCEYCHKQYSNKPKLLSHKRNKHAVMLSDERGYADDRLNDHSYQTTVSSHDVVTIVQPLNDHQNQSMALALQTINLGDGSRVDNTDLLTQALSVNELQQSFDYHGQHTILTHNSIQNGIVPGSIEFRLIPGLDLSNLQMAGLQTSGLTLTVPTSSISPTQNLQQGVNSSSGTSSSNLPSWQQFKFSL